MSSTASADFIREIVAKDQDAKKNDGRVQTRFPPEPNGYLHIGHAKSVCLNFGIAAEFQGLCNLRFDDTNPTKEDREYVQAIIEDVTWLGYDWDDRLYYASDYFERLYEYALHLIRQGKAYVDSLTADEIRAYRGTLTEPGRESPYRNRSVAENLELFGRMKAGDFEEGACVLRAKIDMASANISLRDPTIYRILQVPHHRTGSMWCIYPLYDFTHCLSDSIEGITHSLCTLEFENNRALYDWFLNQLPVESHPQQIEFAPLSLTHTVLSKRRLRQLVEEGHVAGWDDPRMPTLCGLRRRGYTPEAIRAFIQRVGVSKVLSTVDVALLEHFVREDLNRRAPRVMSVLNPLRVVIDNYPDHQEEELEAVNNPEDPSMGSRMLPFSRDLYIERDDFREQASKKYYRLAPGREVRLKHAYYITCTHAEQDKLSGEVVLHCTYDPETRGGWSTDGRKVRGTLHWVSARHALEAEVRLYDHLFTKENPEEGEVSGDFKACLNPHSLEVLTSCKVEPSLKQALPGARYQFLRQGYFCVDASVQQAGKLVFNRTVSLRDSWAKIEKGMQAANAT